MLAGGMMDFPLTLTHFLERARTLFPTQEIVTRRPDRTIERHTFGEFHRRASQLAGALARLGVGDGDRVATLMWNHEQHMEAYLAVPAMGAVVHTLNLRLHPDEIGYIADHAKDKVLLVDKSLLPLWERFRAKAPSIERVIVVPDEYEELIAAESETYAWPALDERQAAMICYTSGTTGNPKGVVYSHRSIVLHTMGVCLADGLAASESDTILAVVPMFHAMAWGLPYAAILVGSRIIMPGPHLDPLSLLELMAEEKVTVAAGVPTIWIGILTLLDQDPKRFDLSRVRSMVVGGSAAPPAMITGFAERHGLEVLHAWGMTETNPLGTVARVKQRLRSASPAEQLAARASQGLPSPLFEIRHVDDGGAILPWDATSMGELEVRGPWVASSYLGGEGADRFTKDGWFKTGDVVTIDADGYMRITDRSKDVIKSGGEWISSVALENALMSHPAVQEAAVFAGRHPKWSERPIAAIVLKPGATVTEAELRDHLRGEGCHFHKIWIPDAFIFMPQIPRTSTGKFLKSKLRADHGDMLMGSV